MRTFIRTNAPATLTKKFYDASGDQADAGATTITVEDANGDEVVATTAATKTGSGTTTEYSYSLAAQPDVAVLYVTWASDDLGTELDVVEVIGDQLFYIAEARAATVSGMQTPLADDNAYPGETLKTWHMYIADLFEQRTAQSFFPRYGRIKLRGDNTRNAWFPAGIPISEQGYSLARGGESKDIRRIISVTVDGVAQDASNFSVDLRGIRSHNFHFPEALYGDPYNVVVEYEYGLLPVPYEARVNAIRMLLANAVNSDIPSRATSFNNEDGTFRLSTHPVEVEDFLRQNNRRGVV